ncbi:hypothetical protein [Wolbachia endosymbiont (group B) of Limnophora tigrina]|uniref:hypothetical protein n=1 Tax=Wolbachia endosymbiont (group B) of Limnophora tigrina TaxID=3139317 RepID=UPI0035B51205
MVVKTQRFDDYEKTGSQCRSTGMTEGGAGMTSVGKHQVYHVIPRFIRGISRSR